MADRPSNYTVMTLLGYTFKNAVKSKIALKSNKSKARVEVTSKADQSPATYRAAIPLAQVSCETRSKIKGEQYFDQATALRHGIFAYPSQKRL